MIRIPDASDRQGPLYVLYDGELMEVVGIGEGRTIHLQPPGAEPCEACGVIRRLDLLEHAPLFQQHVTPVPTL